MRIPRVNLRGLHISALDGGSAAQAIHNKSHGKVAKPFKLRNRGGKNDFPEKSGHAIASMVIFAKQQ